MVSRFAIIHVFNSLFFGTGFDHFLHILECPFLKLFFRIFFFVFFSWQRNIFSFESDKWSPSPVFDRDLFLFPFFNVPVGFPFHFFFFHLYHLLLILIFWIIFLAYLNKH